MNTIHYLQRKFKSLHGNIALPCPSLREVYFFDEYGTHSCRSYDPFNYTASRNNTYNKWNRMFMSFMWTEDEVVQSFYIPFVGLYSNLVNHNIKCTFDAQYVRYPTRIIFPFSESVHDLSAVRKLFREYTHDNKASKKNDFRFDYEYIHLSEIPHLDRQRKIYLNHMLKLIKKGTH